MEQINIIDIIFYVFNTVALISLGIGWFMGKYTIIDLETWNKVAVFFNEHADSNGELIVEELEGGTGFFKECLYDEEDDDYEEEEDDE